VGQALQQDVFEVKSNSSRNGIVAETESDVEIRKSGCDEIVLVVAVIRVATNKRDSQC